MQETDMKESVVMKKAKTAICTLAAALLIVVAASGCASTGAKKGNAPSDEWFIDEAWPYAEDFAAANNLNIEKSAGTVIRYASGSEADAVFTETDGVRSISVSFALDENGKWSVLPAGGVNLLDPNRYGSS